MTASKQTTVGGEVTGYPSAYVYNVSGALVEQTYPSGRVVKNTFDADGSLFTVQSKKNTHPTYWNYAWSMQYNAAGGLTEMQYGNGRWESTQYNERLQPTQIALGYTPNATQQIKLNYSYGGSQNNGNVTAQTVEIWRKMQDPVKFYQEYQYDELNRLKEAKETDITSGGSTQTWKQVFTFDRYGNRNFGAGTTTIGGCPTQVCNPSISQSNNRITSSPWAYDAAGNTITDGSGQTFTYDSENKQKTVVSGGHTNEYFYDGDGKRVKKVVPATGETTIFVYDAAGKSIAEYSTIVAPVSEAKVAYLTNDHLGSPRLNTDRDGNITARNDYLPYGEEITVSLTPQRSTDLGYTPDTVRNQFTGYERDNESGLDFAQARMFGSSLGRFSSPDPLMASARRVNPQTFNRYSYVLNRPMNLTDPSGMESSDNCNGKDVKCPDTKILKPGEKGGSIGVVTVYGSSAELIETTPSSVSIATSIQPRPAPLPTPVFPEGYSYYELGFNGDAGQHLATAGLLLGGTTVWGAEEGGPPGAIVGALTGTALAAAWMMSNVQVQEVPYAPATTATPSPPLQGPGMFRGGPSLMPGSNDLRVRDGLVQTTHGVSVNIDPIKVMPYGGAYRLGPLPAGLTFLQRGSDLGHYEIVPTSRIPVNEYVRLITQVALTPYRP